MRRLLSKELLENMNENVYILTGDLGYGMFDKFFQYHPKQIYNVGAAEQTMMDIAVGMAYSGKAVFTYTITPFYLRAYETIRTYIDHEKLPVMMLGSGRDQDYAHDGFSHDASDIKKVLDPLQNIQQFYPTKQDIPTMISTLVKKPVPSFISLKR